VIRNEKFLVYNMINRIKKDPLVNVVLWIIIGIGIFLGLIALLFLFTGEFGAFIGTAVTGAGFAGLGWAGRKLILPAKRDAASIDVGKIAGFIFGGAGLCMILGLNHLFFCSFRLVVIKADNIHKRG